MLLSDVTNQLGAGSAYEFLTASQWVRARQDIRVYYKGTQINVVVRKGGFWFVTNVGTTLRYVRLTSQIADQLIISQRDANYLLDLPSKVDKEDLDIQQPKREDSMDETSNGFTDLQMKNMAFAMGMFCVATATVFGVKTVVNIVPKGRGK
ncbi:hypothetical protein ST201phi2-1p253 [Pseudomonas phage 201phi2-1]|uniref:Uncharacterized protein n=1 Tax=Pseudomonas phage 201phi2-1 TaxID=198110 RepID=B3FJB5_BP201|nr:hypothetical protein ST201phi2-1p253 [Pseudomonas phage 201phi2-1]ABY63081.1 hypothetical protein 201phi2-1p253 [Pseudomonas phage 201phi2-1]